MHSILEENLLSLILFPSYLSRSNPKHQDGIFLMFSALKPDGLQNETSKLRLNIVLYDDVYK